MLWLARALGRHGGAPAWLQHRAFTPPRLEAGVWEQGVQQRGSPEGPSLAHRRRLPVVPVCFLRVSALSVLLGEDTSHRGLGPSDDLILTSSSVKTLFPIRAHSELLVIKTLT